MDVHELIRSKREAILRAVTRHGASNVRIFGSVARGEARPDSDVDFLVDCGPPSRVPVVTEDALHPLLRKRVWEARPL